MAIKKSRSKTKKAKVTGTSTLVRRVIQNQKKTSMSSSKGNKIAKMAKRVAEKSDSLKQLPYIIAGLIVIANDNGLVKFYKDPEVQIIINSGMSIGERIDGMFKIVWRNMTSDPTNIVRNYVMMSKFLNPRSYKLNFKDPLVLLNIIGFILTISNENTRTDTKSVKDLLKKYQDCGRVKVKTTQLGETYEETEFQCKEKPNLSAADRMIYNLLLKIDAAKNAIIKDTPTV